MGIEQIFWREQQKRDPEAVLKAWLLRSPKNSRPRPCLGLQAKSWLVSKSGDLNRGSWPSPHLIHAGPASRASRQSFRPTCCPPDEDDIGSRSPCATLPPRGRNESGDEGGNDGSLGGCQPPPPRHCRRRCCHPVQSGRGGASSPRPPPLIHRARGSEGLVPWIVDETLAAVVGTKNMAAKAMATALGAAGAAGWRHCWSFAQTPESFWRR